MAGGLAMAGEEFGGCHFAFAGRLEPVDNEVAVAGGAGQWFGAGV